MGDGDYGSRQDEAGDLFGFGSDPLEAIRSGFGCSIGERLADPIQIESESWVGFIGFVVRVDRGCVWVVRGGCREGVRVFRGGWCSVRVGKVVGVRVRVRVGVGVGREYCVLVKGCAWVRVAVRIDWARGVGFGVSVRV